MFFKHSMRLMLGTVMCTLLLSTDGWSQNNFVRGDVNCDGTIDTVDVNLLANHLFTGAAIPCDDAADVNDDGFLNVADLSALTSLVATGGPPPPPPYPNCGPDPTPDPLGCAVHCCPGGVGPRDHFKTWRLFPFPFTEVVDASDQFMTDVLQLTEVELLSNPARKDTFNINRPDDHLTWYRALGRDTLLEIEFDNQFGLDTVLIDSVSYFLVPTQKLPHPPPHPELDHYKAYRIQNPQPFFRFTELEDQFSVAGVPHFVDSLMPVFFLTPSTKNNEPIHDSITHYVAYDFSPKEDTLLLKTTVDQFGVKDVEILRSEFLLVPTIKLNVTVPQPDTGQDHFKSWRTTPSAFTAVIDASDQFMTDVLQLSGVEFLSNPARKDTFDIIHPDDHLSWYRAFGRDTLLEIEFDNQFGLDTVLIDSVSYFLLPTQKLPHAPPDPELDHYKAYRIQNPQPFFRFTELQDQFDVDAAGHLVDSLMPVFFLTPSTKNNEPIHDSVTHYVAYDFSPKQDTLLIKRTVDQFGIRDLEVLRSELLLVPTIKLTVTIPQPDTGQDHFKSWRIQPIPFSGIANVTDQFMDDDLFLNDLVMLSNPARKDTHNIIHPDDHLTWYRAIGRDTLLQVEFDNQFGLDTVIIDGVTHLLVPTQKLPHPPPDPELGHYKAYHIQNPQQFFRRTEIEDQFNVDGPEIVDSLMAVFFLTPCTKNGEPIFDSVTHYVAYDISPKRTSSEFRTTIDQFGTWDMGIVNSELLLVPTIKLSVTTPPVTDTLKNHFKGWQIKSVPFDTVVWVEDQFMSDSLTLDSAVFLANPAVKDTFAIVKPDDHLLWYQAQGTNTCLEVEFDNQFGLDTFVIGTVTHLLLPTQKLPHPPPDSALDHYKAYRVWNPVPFVRSTQVQDQFDFVSHIIDTLVPAYFCTPAMKNSEPMHDSITHYVAYEFYPKQDTTILRTTIDQFGTNAIQTERSELLMVPTDKLAYNVFCPILVPGDVNCTGIVTSSDIIYLVNYVFKGGPAPCPCAAAGDINCDGVVTSADIIQLVNFVFKGGPAPCDPCTIIPALWDCPC